VFFEAPHRIRRTLGDAAIAVGIRPIVVLRELTKVHEELVLSPIDGSPDRHSLSERGEFTLILGPKSAEVSEKYLDRNAIYELHRKLTDHAGLDQEVATSLVAHAVGASLADVKKAVKKVAISVKRQNDAEP
jgi:16S rRNA (cytidine1402-2'-O)-methyltransferase